MENQQLQTIVALIAGVQTAIVHLSTVVAARAGITPDDLATSFEATGEAIPEGIPNRQLTQFVLKQVAAGIRGPSAAAEWEALLSRLLH